MSYFIAVLARSAREQEDAMKNWKKTKNIELTKEVDLSVSQAYFSISYLSLKEINFREIIIWEADYKQKLLFNRVKFPYSFPISKSSLWIQFPLSTDVK